MFRTHAWHTQPALHKIMRAQSFLTCRCRQQSTHLHLPSHVLKMLLIATISLTLLRSVLATPTPSEDSFLTPRDGGDQVPGNTALHFCHANSAQDEFEIERLTFHPEKPVKYDSNLATPPCATSQLTYNISEALISPFRRMERSKTQRRSSVQAPSSSLRSSGMVLSKSSHTTPVQRQKA